MKTQLYEIAEENFNTLIPYYELIKEKTEKYYAKISKFNKITGNYCNNVKNIFSNEEVFFDNDNLNIRDVNKINYEKNLESNIYVNIVISNNKTFRKKINISPIENNIDKIHKIIESYVNSIELLIKSINNLLLCINQNLEKTKLKINDIKNNYSLEKQNYFQKYDEFEELNKKLNLKYFEQEKNLVQYALKMHSLKTKENEKDKQKDENDLNLKIFEAKKFQLDIEKHFKNLGNFGQTFKDSYEKNIKETKDVIEDFYKEFEIQINNFLILYKKSFLTSINELITEKNIFQLKETEFKDILINNIKSVSPELSEINFEEYKMKILNKKILEENDGDENTKILANLIKNSNKKLDDKDIFLIVKKMYNNFKYVYKKDYIIEIEKEMLNLNEKLDKLFNYIRYKKNNDWNLIYAINKNKEKANNLNQNLNNENEGDIFEEDIIVKNEPSDSDFDYICQLMSKKEYRNHFLSRLNKFRTFGCLEMPEKIYNSVIKIVQEISKYLVEEVQTNGEKEMVIDYIRTRFIFILSQTFYYLKNGEKVYLQNGLKGIQIFHSVDFWEKVLYFNIKEELDNLAKKQNKKFTEKEFLENGSQICLMQILPYVNSLNGFGMDKEKIKEISNFFVKEFQLSDENKEILFKSVEDSTKK